MIAIPPHRFSIPIISINLTLHRDIYFLFMQDLTQGILAPVSFSFRRG